MPRAPVRRCSVCRAAPAVERGRCATCAATSSRNHRGVPRQARGHGADYERARRALLAEAPACALRLPGCTGWATSADYRIPVSRGGTLADGLLAVCGHCNAARGNRALETLRRAR